MAAIGIVEGVAATQNGVATVRQCHQAGLSDGQIRTLCRSRRWLRLNQGAYYVAVHNGTAPRIAQIQAAMLSAGPHAVAVLQTAAELHQIDGAFGIDDIHVNLPGVAARDRRSGEPAVMMHQMVVPGSEITTVRGIRATTPARTVADLVLRLDRLQAVSVLDSSLNRRILVPADLDLVLALMAGRRGAARTRSWFDDVDGRAESPLESRVRLRAADAGMRPDELQFPIFGPGGRVVAITDLAWLEKKVIGEADGVGPHDNPEAVFRDRARQNAIVAAGYRPVRFTWDDTRDPWTIPRALRAAMY